MELSWLTCAYNSRIYYHGKKKVVKITFLEQDYRMKEKPIPSTIKFSPELQDKIAEASKRTGLPKQEIIRLCTAIGLEDLRRCNFDIASAIVDQAKGKASAFIPMMVAEESGEMPIPSGKAVPVKYPAGTRGKR